MKMLRVKHTKHVSEVYDDDVCIYKVSKEEDRYVLKNSYDRKIAMLVPVKETFSLFQDKKKTGFDFVYETRNAGSFLNDRNRITLQHGEILFSFYSGRLLGKDMLIGYEKNEFVFQIDICDDKTTLFLKQPEYAVYACLFYIYFMENGKQYSNSSDFLSHLPEDMMSFV